MRPEALRPATARAAAKTSPKPATRLSKGEKRNRKRMAELGAVYDAAPVVRTPADILPDCGANRAEVTAGPTASNKWLTASVVKESGERGARHLRRGRAPGPEPHPRLGRARRRRQPPDRPHPSR